MLRPSRPLSTADSTHLLVSMTRMNQRAQLDARMHGIGDGPGRLPAKNRLQVHLATFKQA